MIHPDSHTKCGHYYHTSSILPPLQCSSPCSSHVPMSTDEKRALLHTLLSDPDLKSDVACLVGSEGLNTGPADSRQTSLCGCRGSRIHNSESGVSCQSASSGFVSSSETSLPLLQRNSFDNGQPSLSHPQLDKQSSIEGIRTQLAGQKYNSFS